METVFEKTVSFDLKHTFLQGQSDDRLRSTVLIL